MANRTKLTDKKRQKFLDSLASGNSVTTAAKQINVGRQTAYDWRNRDEDFAQAWEDAVEQGTDLLEEEAVRRAMNGSDTMLIFLLKGNRGEKYKEKWQGTLDTTTKQSHDVSDRVNQFFQNLKEKDNK